MGVWEEGGYQLGPEGKSLLSARLSPPLFPVDLQWGMPTLNALYLKGQLFLAHFSSNSYGPIGFDGPVLQCIGTGLRQGDLEVLDIAFMEPEVPGDRASKDPYRAHVLCGGW